VGSLVKGQRDALAGGVLPMGQQLQPSQAGGEKAGGEDVGGHRGQRGDRYAAAAGPRAYPVAEFGLLPGRVRAVHADRAQQAVRLGVGDRVERAALGEHLGCPAPHESVGELFGEGGRHLGHETLRQRVVVAGHHIVDVVGA
jgi:hypothetical protein